MQLGLAAYAVLYFVAQQLLEAPGGVIIESNFRRGASEPELRPIATLVVDTADGWRPSYEEVREFAGAPHTGSPR
jgi:hypothetical protein